MRRVNFKSNFKVTGAIGMLYKTGYSVKQIAELYGITEPGVIEHLTTMGIVIEKPTYHKKRGRRRRRPRVGSRRLNSGYMEIYVAKSLFATKAGWMAEHRYVMQNYLQRTLESWEIVHHINRDKIDNRRSNLKVLSRASHPTCIKCPYYAFYLAQGGTDVAKLNRNT